MDSHAGRNRILCDLAIDLVERCAEIGVPLRVLGGVAVSLKCPGYRPFIESIRTPFSDIDLVTTLESSESVARLLAGRGCEENENWRMLRGYQRRVFYTAENITIEVFLGDLHFSQVVRLHDRLMMDCPTISPTDLLLSRVQRISFQRKDLIDICVLLAAHEFGTEPSTHFDRGYIVKLAASSWRWWRTWQNSLAQLDAGYRDILPDCAAGQVVAARLTTLKEDMEAAPKTPSWYLRSLFGDRLKWYDDVEEG